MCVLLRVCLLTCWTHPVNESSLLNSVMFVVTISVWCYAIQTSGFLIQARMLLSNLINSPTGRNLPFYYDLLAWIHIAVMSCLLTFPRKTLYGWPVHNSHTDSTCNQALHVYITLFQGPYTLQQQQSYRFTACHTANWNLEMQADTHLHLCHSHVWKILPKKFLF